MRLLEGQVEEIHGSAYVESLNDEIRDLKRELSNARAETRRVQQQATQSMAELRKQLGPLYRALQMVFGELDAVDDSGVEAQSQPSARASAVWEQWKQRLGSTSRVIDALLTHGELNTGQLAVITGFHRTTIPAHIFKLNKNGLINKNGGRFSLKQL